MSYAWLARRPLTRARAVYGSAAAKNTAQAAIDDVFSHPRDVAILLPEIIKMRGDMRVHKPTKGTLDVKLLPGGLVDAEFVIHALQLSGKAAVAPQLGEAVAQLIIAKALPPAFAGACEILTRLLIILRLMAPDCAPPPVPAQKLIAECLGFDNWPALMAAVENARTIVLKAWEANLGPRDSN